MNTNSSTDSPILPASQNTASADQPSDAENTPFLPAGHVSAIPAAQPEILLAAAYCRVSTDDPSQEGSLAEQAAHWERYISQHKNWRLAGVYNEQGVSATHAETRPVLMRLMADAQAGHIHLILTKSISRFSRNTVDCLSLVRALKALNVSVIFEKENINTGSITSELFLTLLASFAAEESRSLSRNVHMGYTHRFLTGTYKYIRPPYGYQTADGALVPDQAEAAVVADIFDLAISGHGPTAIAEILQQRGIPTKYNATWMSNTIIAIIGNITYTGDVLWQKTYRDENYRQRMNDGKQNRYYVPDHHEAIISREVFILANTTLGYGNPYENLGIIPEAVLTRDEKEEETGGVHVIKAKPKVQRLGRKLRVAAYCRVSTDLDDQEGSYEAQCSHYRALITGKPEWILAGIYADEGISGTSRSKRDQFNRMVEDAENGKIDLILTKSISRFARNTLDCLTVVRKLKSLGVGITFEKEGLSTLDETGEVILTILASIAQQESMSTSQNVRMGIQYRFQRGIPMVNCNRFLGYDKKNGRLVINEAQAGVIRRIFRDYLDGFSVYMIGNDLRSEGIASGCGSTAWPVSTVRYILANEKYAGDLLLQKYMVEDFLTHKVVKNKGQFPQYYVKEAHAPIVPHSVFERAAEEKFLRGLEGKSGSSRFGSRKALIGRVWCPACGIRMERNRRQTAGFRCDACGLEISEAALKAQVMEAYCRLPEKRAEIEEKIAALDADLHSGDRKTRALALRKEWGLRNLLPGGGLREYCPACCDEEDFRARTDTRISAWNDDALIRVLAKVVAGERVEFIGDMSVKAQ